MLMTRAGLSPVMVGRGGELERLRRLLDVAGDPQVALISGEAGVGKTRLLRELLAVLPDGTAVLAGQAEQGALGRPYQLLLEAAEPYLAGWTALPDELAGRHDALRVLLAPVLPGIAAADQRDLAREELLRAAVDLVRHLIDVHGQARPARAVLVFEDLQWADAESLELFGRLATTPGLPALLLGSYRPEQLDRGHLADLAARVERRRSVEHVQVQRLADGELAQLLSAVYGRPVPQRLAAPLHQRTGGNPFFVEELVAASHGAPPETLVSLPLPASLTEAVLRHLDRLDPLERQVVDAAAVLGQRISFDLLAAVTGVAEEQLIQVLRALVGGGLIVEDDVDVFSFRHALSREAVAGRLLGRERRRLHEKALAALQELGSDDWAALAFHARGANRWEELVAAAREGAARYLHAGSTHQALRLAELALGEVDPDLRLLELAARAAWSAGLLASAIDHAEQGRRLAEETNAHQAHVRLLRLLARLRFEAGDLAAQRRLADEVLAMAEKLGPTELVAAYNLAAEARMLGAGRERDWDAELADALVWADRALELAERHGVAKARPAILTNQGSCLIGLPGRVEEGAALLERAAAEAEAHGDHLSELRALHNLAHELYLTWPAARSFELLGRMDRVVERSGRYDWVPTIRLLRAQVQATVEGDLPAARAELRAARDAEADGHLEERHPAILEDAELSIEAGELDRAAVELLGYVQAFATRADHEPGLLVRSHALAAELAAWRGELDEAVGQLDAALLPLGQHRCGDALGAWYRGARAAVRAGLAPPAARALLERLAGTGAEPDPGHDRGWPAHLDGALLEADGAFERALGAYQAALADHGRHRGVPLVADVRLGLARCCLALGRTAAARDHARAAVEVLGRWPGWRKAEAETLLRRLGGAAADGPRTLTPREREVAALVTEGLSNGEIGRRLFVSAKTASVHVSNILAKLGMSSRAEIAAWSVREGLGGIRSG